MKRAEFIFWTLLILAGIVVLWVAPSVQEELAKPVDLRLNEEERAVYERNDPFVGREPGEIQKPVFRSEEP